MGRGEGEWGREMVSPVRNIALLPALHARQSFERSNNLFNLSLSDLGGAGQEGGPRGGMGVG